MSATYIQFNIVILLTQSNFFKKSSHFLITSVVNGAMSMTSMHVAGSAYWNVVSNIDLNRFQLLCRMCIMWPFSKLAICFPSKSNYVILIHFVQYINYFLSFPYVNIFVNI